MEAEHPHPLGHLLVAAGDETAVAEREEVLGREEAEGGADARARDAGGAERLGRVLDQRQPESRELGERRRTAEEVHRHDRLRPRRDARGDVGGVEVEADRIDVGEDGGRAGPGDRLGGRVERERRADHLVPGADAHRLEREHERVGAVGDADRVGHAEIGGRLVLERLDLGAEDEAARLENLREALLELRDQRRVLRLDVDERNHDIRVYRA